LRAITITITISSPLGAAPPPAIVGEAPILSVFSFIVFALPRGGRSSPSMILFVFVHCAHGLRIIAKVIFALEEIHKLIHKIPRFCTTDPQEKKITSW